MAATRPILVLLGSAVLTLAGLSFAACGSSDAERPASDSTTATQAPEPAPAVADVPPDATAAPAPAPPAAPAPDTDPPPDELEAVVRAWSAALNEGDNEAAAALFAPGAIVAQGAAVFQLDTHEDAVRWNSLLPCSGTIVELHVQGIVVSAVFELGDRPGSSCNAAAGTLAAALFAVEGGLITAWQQVPPEVVTGEVPAGAPEPGQPAA